MTSQLFVLANGECHLKTSSNSGVNFIKKLNKNEYLDLRSGEVLAFNHNDKRTDDFRSLSRSFQKIEFLIKQNFTLPQNLLWITLTYAQIYGKPMTDPKRLYHDYNKVFLPRFTRYLKKRKVDVQKFKWIYVVEPQRTGSWHIHMIADFGQPFRIPNSIMAKLWAQGFTKVKAVKSSDNLAAYLSAYLTTDGKGSKKGSRLHFYPNGMRIYRTSRNISQPPVYSGDEVTKKVEALGTPTFVSATDWLVLVNGSFCVIHTEHSKFIKNKLNSKCSVHRHYFISQEVQDLISNQGFGVLEGHQAALKFFQDYLSYKQ